MSLFSSLNPKGEERKSMSEQNVWEKVMANSFLFWLKKQNYICKKLSEYKLNKYKENYT